MEEMSKLITLNNVDDISILNDLFGSEITIYEDVQGSKIYVNYDGNEFTIRSKSISSNPINMVDLAMQNYYNGAINYFNSLDNRIKSLLNKKWYFCFEYFPDNQPANIEYNKVPKNNMVLTSICKNGKFDYTFDELIEYSRLLNVDVLPIIFQGKLSDKAIEAIKYFINTSEKDLEFIFGEKSFAFFFYKILNPQIESSFLMEGDFQKNMERIIIKMVNNDLSFQILNPLYKRISDNNSTDFVETYSLILFNFLSFSQSISLSDINIKGKTRDECYIYLICKLFNMYISEVGEDLANFDITIPEFFENDKFRINKELISNKLTREIIDDNKKLEYFFKVILGSFNKRRKKEKPIGIFTKSTVVLFNNFVDDINKNIDKYLKKATEIEMNRNGLLDFSDFFTINYSTDGDNVVYPSVWDEIEKSAMSKSKKGKDKGTILPEVNDKAINKDDF